MSSALASRFFTTSANWEASQQVGEGATNSSGGRAFQVKECVWSRNFGLELKDCSSWKLLEVRQGGVGWDEEFGFYDVGYGDPSEKCTQFSGAVRTAATRRVDAFAKLLLL